MTAGKEIRDRRATNTVFKGLPIKNGANRGSNFLGARDNAGTKGGELRSALVPWERKSRKKRKGPPFLRESLRNGGRGEENQELIAPRKEDFGARTFVGGPEKKQGRGRRVE